MRMLREAEMIHASPSFSLCIVGGDDMKGYLVSSGYMGWTGAGYQLFSTEEEYVEWYREL